MLPFGRNWGENGLQLNKRVREFVMFWTCCLYVHYSRTCAGSLCLGLLGDVFSSFFFLWGRTLEKHLTVPFLSLGSFSSVPPRSVLPTLLFLSSFFCVLLPGKLNHSMTFCLDLILVQICWVWGPQLRLALHLAQQNETRHSPPPLSTLFRTAHIT